ncbi:hypothetical protein LEP1GSC059_2011 [Leptospira noguchii serovar Panama str. CZ214]|uniref:Uncharacterized protein n=1 Tax=Leptospira noguchii serovar Panama str. CZ214 TaxID=1001595 RepID=T0FI21_9LEPT|nr:hypothetical protein LEP1GSC059_2011 [Leptospira noguchii serovar Panama str. CZ214]
MLHLRFENPVFCYQKAYAQLQYVGTLTKLDLRVEYKTCRNSHKTM